MSKKYSLRNTPSRREAAWGWVILILHLCVLPYGLPRLNAMLPRPLASLWVNLIYCLLSFSLAVWCFRGLLKRSATQAGKQFGRLLKAVILGFVACWALNWALDALIGLLLPGFSNLNDQTVSAMHAQGRIPALLCSLVLAPVAEELLYRGVLFQSLYNRNAKAAYILTSAVFALVHVTGLLTGGQWLNLAISFLQYLPAGLCLAWACAEADNIYAPILIHMVINAVAIYSGR